MTFFFQLIMMVFTLLDKEICDKKMSNFSIFGKCNLKSIAAIGFEQICSDLNQTNLKYKIRFHIGLLL